MSDEEHVIWDSACYLEPDLTIASVLLMNPLFTIDGWYWRHRGIARGIAKYTLRQTERARRVRTGTMGDALADRAVEVLSDRIVYPLDSPECRRPRRFTCHFSGDLGYEIVDRGLSFTIHVPESLLLNERFNLQGWYAKHLDRTYTELADEVNRSTIEWNCLRLLDRGPLSPMDQGLETVARQLVSRLPNVKVNLRRTCLYVVELNGVPVPAGRYPAIQRNAAVTKDFTRVLPKPLVVVVHINGRPARALIDSGSLADFMSLTLAEQLRVPLKQLEKPLTIQLAVQGSRSKVNYGANTRFQYQGIDAQRYFDVINLQNYDLILGTPFLFQHQVTIGFNSPRVVVGSQIPMPMKGDQVSVLESRAAALYHESLDKAREYLVELAKPLCQKASDTACHEFP